MIWLLELPQTTEAELQMLLPLLDEQRRARLSDYRQARSRIESILAGGLLRFAWEEEMGGPMPEIVRTEYGKPVFREPGQGWFNLSHCEKAVCCALSREPVGVDVQPLHRYDGRFRRILSEQERLWIEQADSDFRFTAVWTRKEAYGKALGVGLGYELAETDFSEVFSSWTAFEGWQLRTWPMDGYFLSVCGREDLEIRTIKLEDLQAFARETEEA